MTSMVASAAPSGHWNDCVKYWPITFPIMNVLPPPRTVGMTYSPSAGIQTIVQPAMSPGSDCGKITRRNVANGVAPRCSCRFQHGGVDAVEREKDREHHQWQVAVDDADADTRRCC